MINDILQKKSALVRAWCLKATSAAGSGHPTSCLSSSDIMTVLFDEYFSYDIKNPQNLCNDRIIFSKGHAAPLLYTLFALSNAFDPQELLTLRKFGSRLEGHPTPEFPFADIATGSLGQGLSIGAGIAFSAKKDTRNLKTFVLMGDGELAEGSVWEAANFSSYYKLDNLIAILDINKFGQSQQTMFGVEVLEYEKRFSSFGWDTHVINGHNFDEIKQAFKKAVHNISGKPCVIIAKTIKGKGVSQFEDKENWHGKALSSPDLEKALVELGEVDEGLRFSLKTPNVTLGTPSSVGPASSQDDDKNVPRNDGVFQLGEEIATREVYGKVLAQLGDSNERIYALDGDVKNSTFAQDFKKVFPNRFVECFIAEQNMVGVALGLSRQGKIPFVSTFAAFFTRAFDQIRMSALSKANIKFVGSHGGVSIGEDGGSQMGLEDIAMFGSIFDSVVLHPCDGVSTSKLLPLMVKHDGISYLRTLRSKTPVLYEEKEYFRIGGSKLLRKSENDLLTIVTCGITVFEALKAYEELKKENIMVRVVDCYSIKPIDKTTIEQCSNETIKPIIITVEDHFEHGGLGEFVSSALSTAGILVYKMSVSKMPRSGNKDDLLNYMGINASHIVARVKEMLQ